MEVIRELRFSWLKKSKTNPLHQAQKNPPKTCKQTPKTKKENTTKTLPKQKKNPKPPNTQTKKTKKPKETEPTNKTQTNQPNLFCQRKYPPNLPFTSNYYHKRSLPLHTLSPILSFVHGCNFGNIVVEISTYSLYKNLMLFCRNK